VINVLDQSNVSFIHTALTCSYLYWKYTMANFTYALRWRVLLMHDDGDFYSCITIM